MEFKERNSRSWLSGDSGPAVAAAFAGRLIERCQGEQGVFLTLTYDRSAWEDPQQLYRAAAAERHVRLFLRKLGAALGEDFGGRWVCKMEWQDGGWIHWHLVLLGVKFVPHAVMQRAWDMGHTWVERLTERNQRYLAKYVAKPGALVPAYLLLERRGSVKIIRTSPGFWRTERRPAESDQPSGQRLPWYVTVGDMLGRAPCVYYRHDGEFRRWFSSAVLFAMAMRNGGLRLVGGAKGWLGVQGASFAAVEAAASEASGLHLIHTRNPHSGRPGPPPWIDEYLSWALGWREIA